MDVEGKEVLWIGFDGKKFMAKPKIKIRYYCPDCGNRLIEHNDGILACAGNYWIRTAEPYGGEMVNVYPCPNDCGKTVIIKEDGIAQCMMCKEQFEPYDVSSQNQNPRIKHNGDEKYHENLGSLS